MVETGSPVESMVAGVREQPLVGVAPGGGAAAGGPSGGGLAGAFRSMSWPARLSILWLVFIVGGAIYAKLDDLVFDQALPLQDQFYQGNLFGTAKTLEGPSASHVLGTDSLARDTFARIVHGGWVSLIVALASVSFGVVFGGLIGTFVGYKRGLVETGFMSAIDVILAFPPLVLLLAVVSLWEERSLLVISLVIGFLSIPVYTRISRANTLTVANREFVHAAQAIGTRPWTILFREIIPNVLPTVLAYAMVASANILVIEGTLSFLGLSVQLPTPSWGNMINEGRANIKVTILPVMFPSLALTFTVLSLNQLGDWFLRRAAYRSSAL